VVIDPGLHLEPAPGRQRGDQPVPGRLPSGAVPVRERPHDHALRWFEQLVPQQRLFVLAAAATEKDRSAHGITLPRGVGWVKRYPVWRALCASRHDRRSVPAVTVRCRQSESEA
jgi:hypothetical protein